VVPEFAVEQVEFVPSTEPLGKENGTLEPGVPNSVRRRCEVSGWYGLSVSVLKAIGVFAAVAVAARGFVAFGAWRTSLRNRLIGVEAHRQGTR
jgi:hypothetical protein